MSEKTCLSIDCATLPIFHALSLIHSVPIQSRFIGMVFYNIGWSLSIMMAPFIGGLLSDPVLAYPNAMKHFPECFVDLFRAYPFLLPNLVVAIFNFLAIIVFLFKLKETRVKDEITQDTETRENR